MANSDFLRQNKNQHSIKNSASKRMDKDINVAVSRLLAYLTKTYPGVQFEHKKKLPLSDIIANLKRNHAKIGKSFGAVLAMSHIKPDGGIIYATLKDKTHPILISEVKRQGTNDKRAKEGLPKQAQGNAIERLGKNLIGIRAIYKHEKITPFVCFGSGYDFKEGSSIRDRVITMNDFHPLGEIFIEKNGPFEPVSMLFRETDWSVEEMYKTLKLVSEKSMRYFFKI